MTDIRTTRLFTDSELASLCCGGTERMTEALASGIASQARDTYEQLEGAMRGFCTVYLDWLALIDEYVFETHGHEGHVRSAAPERIAELAVRTGMSLEDLVLGKALAASPDNP